MTNSTSSTQPTSLYATLWFRAWALCAIVLLALAPLGITFDLPWLTRIGLLAGASASSVAVLLELESRARAMHSAWQHRTLLATALVVGGGIAVLIPLIPQLVWDVEPADLGSNVHTLLVGPVEEAAKLIVPVLLWRMFPTLDVRTKVVIAVLAAMGFQVLENLLVVLGVALATDPLVSVFVLLSRAIVGVFAHPMWTATIAAAWLCVPAAWRTTRARRVTWRTGAFFAVAALHSFWDFSTTADHRLIGSACVLAALIATLLLYRATTKPLATMRA